MLPNERAASRHVYRQHVALFRNSKLFHSFAVKLVAGGALELRGLRDLDELVCIATVGLLVKACRQHRSVQLLARIGLGSDALAMTRCLFETTLALAFILKKRVRLRREGQPLPRVHGWPLNSRFRARLYTANIAFESDRALREFQRTRGLRRYRRRKAAAATVAQQVRDAEQGIGQEWSKRLRESRSYSGLSVKNLAMSVGLAPTYATLYRYASWSVHAIDLTHFITVPVHPGQRPRVHLAPHDGDVARALDAANSLLLGCMRLFNYRFGLARDNAIQRHGARLNLL